MAIADLAADMARALDPVRLAAQAGFAPDPWQCDVLRSMAPRVLLLCSRQAGKSTVTSLLGVQGQAHSITMVRAMTPATAVAGHTAPTAVGRRRASPWGRAGRGASSAPSGTAVPVCCNTTARHDGR